MKKISTISFDDVKTLLRRGNPGCVQNDGGWCVYVNEKGRPFYVVDGLDSLPVAFSRLSAIRPLRQAPATAVLNQLN